MSAADGDDVMGSSELDYPHRRLDLQGHGLVPLCDHARELSIPRVFTIANERSHKSPCESRRGSRSESLRLLELEHRITRRRRSAHGAW
jgi:hypothetical protein